jgi:hypothetical protein
VASVIAQLQLALSYGIKGLGWAIANWAILTAIANLAIDMLFHVPADSAPEWKPWMEAHPRTSGFVRAMRGGGADVLKLATGLLTLVTKATRHDPASAFPPANTDGGIE